MMRYSLLTLLLLLSVPLMAVEKVQVLGLFTGKAVVKIDGKRSVLAVGESTDSGVKLISADSRKAVLEIDGERRELPLGNEITTHYTAPQRAEAIINRDQFGMFHTVGSINGQMVEFLADTGATLIALNASDAKRLGIDFRTTGQQTQVATASGLSTAYVVKLKTVRVGEIELRDVNAAVLEGKFPDKALLGMSFLGQLQVINEDGLMRLRKKY